MRTVTNKLILAGYGLLSLIVLLIFAIFFRDRPITLPQIENTRHAVGIGVAPRSNENSRSLAKQLRFDAENQRRRIRELQQLLSAREKILQQQSTELRQQTQETIRLDAEADRYFRLLTELLSESEASIENSLETLRDADASGTAASLTLQSLAESPDIATAELANAETALAAADWELQQRRLSEESTKEALEQASNMNESLRTAILEARENAVPILLDILSGNADVETRVWAATSLGIVGTDSEVAMDALLVALEGDNAVIAAAANTAIQLLDGS